MANSFTKGKENTILLEEIDLNNERQSLFYRDITVQQSVLPFSISKGNKKLSFKKILTSNLDFNANKKNQISRHYWHSFPAKFPPDLPKLFIENLTNEGEVVLDPMAGSCTTLIEAANLNRKAIGFDIDPLSLIIGNAKLENINVMHAKIETNKILNAAYDAFHYQKSEMESILKSRFDEETLKFLNYWLLKETQLELISIIKQVEKVKNENLKNFFKLIFSGIIITKSGGVTLSLDLAHTRPHRVITKIPNSALSEFAKKANRILNNGYADLPSDIHLEEGNAKSLKLKDKSIDFIITSPPYANNAIDYMRAHKFALVWFGYKISELKNTRKKYIGSENIDNNLLSKLPAYPEIIVSRLSEVNKNKAKVLHRYYSEMQCAIEEMYRVLKPQSACAIVVASSILNEIDVETHFCLAEIGKAAGFELVHIGERNINRDSRMLPVSRQKNGSQMEARMHNEYIIGLWKS